MKGSLCTVRPVENKGPHRVSQKKAGYRLDAINYSGAVEAETGKPPTTGCGRDAIMRRSS